MIELSAAKFMHNKEKISLSDLGKYLLKEGASKEIPVDAIFQFESKETLGTNIPK